MVEPGFFKTNLHNTFEYAIPGIGDYDKMRNNALQVLADSIRHGNTPEPVARVVMKILHTKNPKYSYRVGKVAWMAPLLQFVSYRLFEFGTARKFRV